MKVTIEQVQTVLNRHNMTLCTSHIIFQGNQCCPLGAAILAECEIVPSEGDLWIAAYIKFGKQFVREFYLAFDAPMCHSFGDAEGAINGLEIRKQAEELGLI